jgi:hypothetical protein
VDVGLGEVWIGRRLVRHVRHGHVSDQTLYSDVLVQLVR